MIFFFIFGKCFWQEAQSCDHTAVLATGCVREKGCGRSWARGELGETDMPCFKAQSLGCELKKWWSEGRFWRDKGLDHFHNRAEGDEEGWAQSLTLMQGVHARIKTGPAGQLQLQALSLMHTQKHFYFSSFYHIGNNSPRTGTFHRASGFG